MMTMKKRRIFDSEICSYLTSANYAADSATDNAADNSDATAACGRPKG